MVIVAGVVVAVVLLVVLLGHTLVGGLVFVMRFKQNAIFRFEHPYGVFGCHARLNVQKTVRLGS